MGKTVNGRVVNNYSSFDVVFTSGNGSVLVDKNKKKYIDFTAGIGVNCLGHNYRPLVKAIQKQAEKEIHISNYYNSNKGIEFADRLLRVSGMDGVFFGNSGAEANEAAIKLARKYGWQCTHKDGSSPGVLERKTIITLEKSFHGRTLAALTATGQDVFHSDCFSPYPDGFKTIPAGDYNALKSFDETVCAVLIEGIQGEGGVNLLDPDWARACEKAARDCGALFMMDEVQTGMGRTGNMFAFQTLGLSPDVVTLAKGIAGGIPMGACLFRGKASGVFVSGDHQSTFGGNPLACAAGLAVLDAFEAPDFMDRVSEAGERLRETIRSWNLPCIKDVRGCGLMIGVDVDGSCGNASAIQKACLQASPVGLCISTAGNLTLRFLPPLVITDRQIDEGLAVLKSVLTAFN